MPDAGLVVINANVVTLNDKQPRAQAIAIRHGKIVAVGTNEEVNKHAGPATKIIDAKGKTMVPGLVDCHVHMTGLGYSAKSLDWTDTYSIKDAQEKLRTYATDNSEKEWITGGRWNQERFAEKRLPTRRDLDEIVKDKPVCLMRVCGHIGVANSRALQIAGIAKNTVVEGGEIDLDARTGEPTGILRENALELIWKVMPKPSQKELEEACLAACQKAVEVGLTCVHWMVTSRNEIRALQNLHSKGKLPLRVCLGIAIEFLDQLTGLKFVTGYGDGMLKIGFMKILADGSLGAQTAALREPYSDKPETNGMLLYTQRKLNTLVSRAHQAGLQVAIHAIGDRAVDSVLKAYEKALEEHPRENHRHRIEHCSVLNPKLIKRMKRLNLVASVQPHFVVSDFWALDRLGESRIRWMFPFKTLMQEQIVVTSGSDCPVEPINPILGIWAAVARKTVPEERLSIEEALKTYTLNAAFASFDEDRRGTLKAGKLADLTVLSDDPFSVAPDDIRSIRVEMTMVNGEIVYSRQHSQRVT